MVKQRKQRLLKRAIKQIAKPAKKRSGLLKRVAKKIKRNLGKSTITPLGSALRAGGTALGGMFGHPGAGLTAAAGISRLFGQGDYVVEEAPGADDVPGFGPLLQKTRIRHREYIMDVQSSTGFADQNFVISPTNTTLFPWLSTIAVNYTHYRFHSLVFSYKTTSGNAISSTNNALGVVGLSTLYNPALPAFGSKREAMDNVGCTSKVPSCSFLHGVECKLPENPLNIFYVQVQGVSDSNDNKWFSLGSLNLFTQGMQQAGVNIGELHVSYDVEFMDPRILPVGAVKQAASKITCSAPATNNQQILGNVDLPQSAGNLGCFYTASTGAVTIPAGTASGWYFASFAGSYGAASTFTFSNITASANIVGYNYFQNNSTELISTPNASNGNSWHGFDLMIYKTNNAAGTFTIITSASPGTLVTGDITIVKVPPSLVGQLESSVSNQTDVLTAERVYDQVLAKLKRLGILGIVDEMPELVRSRPVPGVKAQCKTDVSTARALQTRTPSDECECIF